MKVSVVFAALLSHVLAASRTSPPSGCLHVAKSGGTHTSLQAAVNSLSTTAGGTQCIFVNQGTYTEQVYIPSRSAQLTLYGYTTDTTSYTQNRAIITFNNNQANAGNNDRSATLRVHAANVKVYNLNVVNSFGPGSQALALSAQASSGYYGCQFYGFQDTVLANEGQEYYSNCLITGATDFVFGQRSQAWFEKVDLRVRSGGQYITANGRDSSSNPSYYVFNSGTIAAASGESVPSRSYYLGRPWRDWSRVVFQRTSMSNVVRTEGWRIWSDGQSTANIYYAEFSNAGEGSTGSRVSWSRKLGSAVSISAVLGSNYASQPWFDASYPS
ncbi:family 8 carbohydrate esterase [Stachybotrys elegans]|uniref:Pectinesterase n=1 Tax=Stachybotrys elegans TaxID=80388 RepID=A0A8K0SJI0_9HYPO|nr:family 8 carbohydrate esterase [Stachybotrys elegans]